MAIRRSAVRPDPQTGMVSRDAHMQAFADLEAMVWMAGGVGSVIVDRERTDMPGEMVTTFAVVEWKDRTDARPVPEDSSHALEQEAQPPADAANPLLVLSQQLGVSVDDLIARIAGGAPLAEAEQPVAVSANGVGEPRDEPDEDVSSIPEEHR